MKTLASCILIAVVAFSASKTNYSTTSVVTLVGAKISAEQKETVVKKYKRKDCPVCKGKGWYISGMVSLKLVVDIANQIMKV